MGLIAVLVMPSIVDSLNKSKETSYKVLINNIKVAAETYYEECEYGDLSDQGKYGDYDCKIETDPNSNNYIEITLSDLANTGFLSVKDVDENNKKQVLDPRNNNNISDCQITITKNIDEKYKVTYTITPKGGTNCPTEYGSVE